MTARLRQLDPQRLTKPIKERLDTSLLAHPKPAQSVPQQPKDGRLKETPSQYRRSKVALWEKQNRRCANCQKYLPGPVFGHRHHLTPGNGKKDDRLTILLCPDCHDLEHPGPQWSGEKSA